MTPKRHRLELAGYYFIAPAFLMLLLVLVFPYAYTVYLSVHDVTIRLATNFSGLKNYRNVLDTPVFFTALKNLLVLVIFSGLFQFLLGLAGALVLVKGRASSYLLRTLLLLPWTVPGVVTALIWLWIFDGHVGILNQILVGLGIKSTYMTFLASTTYAMPSIIVADVWRGFPFVMVMLLAGLQAVPQEQYDAAAVDGASGIQQFWHVTLPNIRQVIAITLILTTIWNFKTFDLVWVLTRGGPGNATEILSTLIYRSAFTNLNFGFASAVAILMLITMLIPIVIYIRFLRDE